jgi:adenylate cyclase
MNDAATARLVQWITRSGPRYRSSPRFVEALAEKMNEEGLPIDRITTGINLLHPLVFSSSCLWTKEQGVGEKLYPNVADTMRLYQNSPLPRVWGAGETVRCRIGPTAEPGEYPILADLRADGYTDYVVLPLPFSDGTNKAIAFATRRPDGFLPADLESLEALLPTVALVMENETLLRTARTLMETYVGESTGSRVLEGSIMRGTQETIAAIVWLCDLRGFTALTESLPGPTLIALLNDYFGAMCEAVSGKGGEVLKFIGDALLAIFPLAGRDARSTASDALAAAGAAQSRIVELNTAREAAGDPHISYGLALHEGEVLYGNIGGETRLDFTVIGPAVNIAARLQGLCAPLRRRVLVSDAFAALVDPSLLIDLGEHSLKGIARPQHVFALADADLGLSTLAGVRASAHKTATPRSKNSRRKIR